MLRGTHFSRVPCEHRSASRVPRPCQAVGSQNWVRVWMRKYKYEVFCRFLSYGGKGLNRNQATHIACPCSRHEVWCALTIPRAWMLSGFWILDLESCLQGFSNLLLSIHCWQRSRNGFSSSQCFSNYLRISTSNEPPCNSAMLRGGCPKDLDPLSKPKS